MLGVIEASPPTASTVGSGFLLLRPVLPSVHVSQMQLGSGPRTEVLSAGPAVGGWRRGKDRGVSLERWGPSARRRAHERRNKGYRDCPLPAGHGASRCMINVGPDAVVDGLSACVTRLAVTAAMHGAGKGWPSHRQRDEGGQRPSRFAQDNDLPRGELVPFFATVLASMAAWMCSAP